MKINGEENGKDARTLTECGSPVTDLSNIPRLREEQSLEKDEKKKKRRKEPRCSFIGREFREQRFWNVRSREEEKRASGSRSGFGWFYDCT